MKSNGNYFNDLKKFYDKFCVNKKEWLFGYLTYDLKNEIEKLKSENHDRIQFPEINFFVPQFVFELNNNTLYIHVSDESKKNQDEIFHEIQSLKISEEDFQHSSIKLGSRISKKKYAEIFEKILQHIHRGDVYELNFCQEFYSENRSIDPALVFKKLCEISPAPFSCYYKLSNHYLLCASPERFLRKQGDRIISQPIKGTIKRGKDSAEDLFLKSKFILFFGNKKLFCENEEIFYEETQLRRCKR